MVAYLRVGEIESPQCRQGRQMRNARISDSDGMEVQRGEAADPRNFDQSGVGDVGTETDLIETGDIFKRGQARVTALPAAVRGHHYLAGTIGFVAILDRGALRTKCR